MVLKCRRTDDSGAQAAQHDLSTPGLTLEEKTVLSKGLKFIPPPSRGDPLDQTSALHSFSEYTRRVLLRLHFGQSDDDKPNQKLRAPSDWTPQVPSPVVKTYLDNMKHTLTTHTTTRTGKFPHEGQPNFTDKELNTLHNLSKRNDIVIKPADKGGAIVIMNTSAYTQACSSMLSDPNHYGPPTTSDYEVKDETDFIINTLYHLRVIPEKLARLCIEQTHGERPFFGLPKIHKDHSKWKFGLPPLRPIISDCPSATYMAGKLLDTFLQPVSTTHPSYVKDTPHMLQILHSCGPIGNQTLFTSDVESLYTNIPHTVGSERAIRALTHHSTNLSPRAINLLTRLLKLQLEQNNFLFEDKQYTQTHGVAMGKSWAPAYANIYMAEWERDLTKATTHLPQPHIWKRFIDDIFGTYGGTETQLDEYLDIANPLDPNIRITTQRSKESLPFLDLTISTHEGTLSTKLYRKPIDTFQYIRNDSGHPITTKRAVVHSQYLRVLRNCTLEVDKAKQCTEVTEAFVRRGYSAGFLKREYRAAKRHHHRETHTTIEATPDSPTNQPKTSQKRTNPKGPILAINYHPRIRDLPTIMRRAHENTVQELMTTYHTNKQALDLLKDLQPPTIAWKRRTNLADNLIRAKTPKHHTQTTTLTE